jgi:hypothetical protein
MCKRVHVHAYMLVCVYAWISSEMDFVHKYRISHADLVGLHERVFRTLVVRHSRHHTMRLPVLDYSSFRMNMHIHTHTQTEMRLLGTCIHTCIYIPTTLFQLGRHQRVAGNEMRTCASICTCFHSGIQAPFPWSFPVATCQKRAHANMHTYFHICTKQGPSPVRHAARRARNV